MVGEIAGLPEASTPQGSIWNGLGIQFDETQQTLQPLKGPSGTIAQRRDADLNTRFNPSRVHLEPTAGETTRQRALQPLKGPSGTTGWLTGEPPFTASTPQGSIWNCPAFPTVKAFTHPSTPQGSIWNEIR